MQDLTFMMGKVAAILPTDRLYARNHMWCKADGERCRIGFSAYAVRLMKDVYFLEWHLEAGDAVEYLQPIGHIETSKAVSDLFAPLAGTITEFNPALLQDPSGINVDGYGDGWLFDITARPDALMTAKQYHDFLAESWEKTQTYIKGKINAEQ